MSQVRPVTTIFTFIPASPFHRLILSINFCLTQRVAITNGKQINEGSCNPAPIGRIPAKNRMPSSKFINPPNFSDNLATGQPFQIQMKIVNLNTGQYVNANVSLIYLHCWSNIGLTKDFCPDKLLFCTSTGERPRVDQWT